MCVKPPSSCRSSSRDLNSALHGAGFFLPSHGENRGSSPLGSANYFNGLAVSLYASVPAVSRRPFALRSFSCKIIFLWSTAFAAVSPKPARGANLSRSTV